MSPGPRGRKIIKLLPSQPAKWVFKTMIRPQAYLLTMIFLFYSYRNSIVFSIFYFMVQNILFWHKWDQLPTSLRQDKNEVYTVCIKINATHVERAYYLHNNSKAMPSILFSRFIYLFTFIFIKLFTQHKVFIEIEQIICC